MFHFTIRDVLWLTVVAAVCMAWWIDRQRRFAPDLWESRAEHLASVCRDQGWTVHWHGNMAMLAYPPAPGLPKPEPAQLHPGDMK